MNRRKLLSLLGAAPAAAALPAVAETPIPATTPILGELRHHAEIRPVYGTSHSFGYGYLQTVAVLKIFDGEKWVDEDSQAGVDVKNKVLRS